MKVTRAHRRIVLGVALVGCVLLVAVIGGFLKDDLLAFWYLRRLEGPDTETSLEAMERLGELGAATALPRLLGGPPRKAAGAENLYERWVGVLAAIVVRDPGGSLEHLVEAIEDPVAPHRDVALSLLPHVPPPRLARCAPSVGRLLADEDDAVVRSALAALGHVGEHAAGAVPALLQYYARELPDDDDDGWGDFRENERAVRVVSARFPPAHIAGGKVVGILLAVAARDPDVVACALGDAGWPAARAVLREALGQVRVDLVLEALRCPSPEARRFAATVLGEVEERDERVVRALEAARDDDTDPRVRELAAQSLRNVRAR